MFISQSSKPPRMVIYESFCFRVSDILTQVESRSRRVCRGVVVSEHVTERKGDREVSCDVLPTLTARSLFTLCICTHSCPLMCAWASMHTHPQNHTHPDGACVNFSQPERLQKEGWNSSYRTNGKQEQGNLRSNISVWETWWTPA